MRFTGFEDYTPEELESLLVGDAVPTDDLEGVHGVLLLLSRRVGQIDARLRTVELAVDELRLKGGS